MKYQESEGSTEKGNRTPNFTIIGRDRTTDRSHSSVMIRARVINSITSRNVAANADVATNTTKPLFATNVSSKKRDARGETSNYAVMIVAIVTLILSVYSIFGLYTMLHTDVLTRPIKIVVPVSNVGDQTPLKVLDEIRAEFNERYKVKNNGKIILDGPGLLKNGLYSFGSIENTARRILEAASAKRPFVMAFSGYSITVGRGNFYNQSFPFVVGNILEGPMQSIFGIPLVVRNSAIGGIPSFPYGFCLEHFLGSDPDVVSWDYSMNEGARDASVLEAFLRQVKAQLPKNPMVIMADTNKVRMKALDEYTHKGWLKDAIAIGDKGILNEQEIFGDKERRKPEEQLPVGFREWDQFGAPKNCPGRGSWHPKRQEHAMRGWMIAMHFVDAMEKAIAMKAESSNHFEERQVSNKVIKFGKPVSNLPQNDPEVTELLFGHTSGNTKEEEYVMKQLSCRTSFLPATDHTKTLPSVVVSGLGDENMDIMTDRSDKDYRAGWVLDVSTVERDTKRKVERCGGLGYVDMKIALYGVPESGKLRLWLPFEGPSHDHHNHDGADANAKHWFDDFVLCEANEKRGEEACQLNRDLEIIVGGVEVTPENIHPLKGAAEYLKRPTCVNVGVPKDAVVTTLGDLRTSDGKQPSARISNNYGRDALGMVVDVKAKQGVRRETGACCLSHIVWEQH